MSYQALYRLYRPQRFDEMVGQEAIVKTLKNAISNNKTSHAYLFTGPRGTGKTSAAKIFSKAINCPNQEDGEPCNACHICEQITQGSMNDVIEIDAASNNGVEEIRNIREKANYSPTVTEYKVYIIDEVHMLSKGAFNALLKTLEEPPEKVVFILATTEPHKIPLTIISRVQRFDFRRISSSEMVRRMEEILKAEEVKYDEDTLDIIAQAADGGMRDALTVLDQAITFSDEKVTTEDAIQVTGSLTQEFLIDYFNALSDKDTEKGLAIVHEALADGKDVGRFVEDVILFSRDILIHKITPENTEILQKAKISAEFETLSDKVETNLLYDIIRVFNETQQELRLSNHATVYLEVATVQLTHEQATPAQAAVPSGEAQETIDQLEEQVAKLSKKIEKAESNSLEHVHAEPTAQTTRQASKPTRSRPSNGRDFTPNRTGIYDVLTQATRTSLDELQEVWPDLLSALTVTERAVMKASEPVAASEEAIVVTFDYDILCQKAMTDESLRENVGDYLEKITGTRMHLQAITSEDWPAMRQEFINQMKADNHSQSEMVQKDKEETETAEETDIVEEAIKRFGEEVVQVENN